ncbi:methionine--tRNA ligase [Nonomuraea sp. NPDC049684]|uniref:methionine--tRNA ligase n=1 Tax=Nonomuraea sp. NPDC049684 TaxID=3364356 RepID=UPI00379B1B78
MYITTTIPYVNARPHLGHALELVQADVLARRHRRRGEPVRFQTGTDDNSLKNVLAAEAEGLPVREFVDRNAAAFEGPCPEGHEGPLQVVSERNWFFRLSRYQDALLDLVRGGGLRIEPAARRNEVLAFVEAGLADISVSRSAARARGWGIPVPGDPTQVVYVWWDALANYVTALEGADHERWWVAEPDKVHLVGKGVIRFHAVYWPAMLLAAGEPLPSQIFVHDYLTVNGRKISKSSGTAVDPVALVKAYGVDAVRWWLLREVPRVGDADFTEDRLIARADEDLANGVGNLVNRVATMVHRFLDGNVPEVRDEFGPGDVDGALRDFDFRRAAGAVWRLVEEANRYVERVRPWQQAAGGREASLGVLVGACRTLAVELEPFLPTAAARVAAAVSGERLPRPEPLFPRLTR